MRTRLFLSLLLGERVVRRRGSFLGRVAAASSGKGGEASGLTLVCFSYQRDFSILKTSLASLRRACPEAAFNYILVSDRKAPFTAKHLAVLQETLGRPIEHWTTPLYHGSGGLRVFVNELDAFDRLAARLGGRAWITKIDSDILFFSRDYFDLLISDRNHDHIFQDVRTTLGGRPRPWPSYGQGGCYSFRAEVFVRARQAPALRSFAVAFWQFVKRGALGGFCTLAEDFLIYFHLAPFAAAPMSTTFLVPCPLRRHAQVGWTPRIPSLMHFERCGSEMESYYAAWVQRSENSGSQTV